MVLMIDNSGSMCGNRLQQAKEAAKNLITKMFDFKTHRMALMTFESKPELLSPLTNSPKILAEKLPGIRDRGSTEMVSAFRMAENALENSNRQKIILMVTDGYPDYPAETLPITRKLRHNGVKIIAIGVGKDFNRSFLDEMVGEKNAFTIKNMSELTATFERVINALKKGEL